MSAPVVGQCLFGQREIIGKRLTVEDKVKLESKRLGPILLASVDEVVSTELLSILFLVLGVRQSPNFSAESVSPEKSEVTKTTDSGNANLFTGAATQAD